MVRRTYRKVSKRKSRQSRQSKKSLKRRSRKVSKRNSRKTLKRRSRRVSRRKSRKSSKRRSRNKMVTRQSGGSSAYVAPHSQKQKLVISKDILNRFKEKISADMCKRFVEMNLLDLRTINTSLLSSIKTVEYILSTLFRDYIISYAEGILSLPEIDLTRTNITMQIKDQSSINILINFHIQEEILSTHEWFEKINNTHIHWFNNRGHYKLLPRSGRGDKSGNFKKIYMLQQSPVDEPSIRGFGTTPLTLSQKKSDLSLPCVKWSWNTQQTTSKKKTTETGGIAYVYEKDDAEGTEVVRTFDDPAYDTLNNILLDYFTLILYIRQNIENPTKRFELVYQEESEVESEVESEIESEIEKLKNKLSSWESDGDGTMTKKKYFIRNADNGRTIGVVKDLPTQVVIMLQELYKEETGDTRTGILGSYIITNIPKKYYTTTIKKKTRYNLV